MEVGEVVKRAAGRRRSVPASSRSSPHSCLTCPRFAAIDEDGKLGFKDRSLLAPHRWVLAAE